MSATIGTLEAIVGKIETLVNGNLSSENIQEGGITSDKLTIANGFIKNAMINSLDVSKINAGIISTVSSRFYKKGETDTKISSAKSELSIEIGKIKNSVSVIEGTYAKKTEVETSVNGLKVSVSESGGENLIYNSRFMDLNWSKVFREFLGDGIKGEIYVEQYTRDSIAVSVKLDYISKGVDDIRLDKS